MTQRQMRDILSRTSKDRIVYEASLVLFNERVELVEKEVGFRFLHCEDTGEKGTDGAKGDTREKEATGKRGTDGAKGDTREKERR